LIGVAIGIQVVVKLSKFYVQEQDKNTLGRTEIRETESVLGPISGETLLPNGDFFLSKWQKKVLMGFSTHQLLGEKNQF
jgi:hypothetical protein